MNRNKIQEENRWGVRVERQVCPRTVVSVNQHCTNPAQRARVDPIQSGHHHHPLINM